MSDSELAERRVGSTLQGKWTLEKVLGVGGMASVYLARHKIGRLDAIKVLHLDIAHSALLRQRFEQEARVVNTFRHKGAVEIRDIDMTEDGAPFLVMELLAGESLSSLVHRSGPLPPERVLRIADETLDVLAAAHAKGIIHRDIKPDNLFILEDGSVKVLDFGIARLIEAPADRKLKTKTGTTLGTATYMAPEQARGLVEIDGRADIYAVGATMFRVLTNRRVHEGDTQVEILMKVISDPAPKLASVAPQMPAAVCAVVDRALAFERNDRYGDAGAMQVDVRAALAGDLPKVPVPQAYVSASPKDPTAATVMPVLVAPAPVAPAPRAPDPATAVRGADPSTFVAAPSPDDLRASAPSTRNPPVVAQAEAPTYVRKKDGTILGLPLFVVILGGAGVLLACVIGIVVIGWLFTRSSSSDPVSTTPDPVPTSTGSVQTTSATTATTPAAAKPVPVPPSHGKGHDKKK